MGKLVHGGQVYTEVRCGDAIVTFKNYAKFNGTGLILPFQLNDDYEVHCEFYIATYAHDKYIVGSSCSWNDWSKTPYIAMYNNNFIVGLGSGSGSAMATIAPFTSGLHEYISNTSDNKVYLDEYSLSFTPRTMDYNYTLGCEVSITELPFTGYIKSFKIYSKSTGDLLHHIKPCLFNNIPALCDVIDNTLIFGSGLQVVDEIPS